MVDDLSTDNTDEVLKTWTEKDGRFKYFKRHREPKGAPTCRNIGLDKAEGEYIIFLDSDDLLVEFCLEERIEKFNENQNCDFLVFSTLEFLKKPYDSKTLLNVENDIPLITRFLNLDVPWITMSVIWKRTSFLKLGKWNEIRLSWQDWEMHLLAVMYNLKYRYFKTVDSFLRRDPDYQTIGVESLSNRHINSHLRLLEDLKDKIGNRKDYTGQFIVLVDWLGIQAIQKGNRSLALRAIFLSLKAKLSLRNFKNIFTITFYGKISYPNTQTPNFGTMRKVQLEN